MAERVSGATGTRESRRPALCYPPMASPGRNDPCPCGSGRKYKHCCLAKADTADQLRVRVRRAEGRVVDALFPFALDQYGKTFFEQAWLEFWAGEPPEDAEEFTDVPEFENMFVPWFVTSFVADPADQATHPGWPAVPVGLKWLETRTALDSTEREWLVAACASPMSLFVVEATDPGRSLDIRDVLTGRRFHVLEQSASRTLKPNDLHFTRVVSAGGVSLMFGAAPYPIPPQFHLRALEWRDTISGRQKLTREDLVEFDVEIRNLYHTFVDELLNPPAPRLRNTDGDELALTTMVYELKMSVADAF